MNFLCRLWKTATCPAPYTKTRPLLPNHIQCKLNIAGLYCVAPLLVLYPAGEERNETKFDSFCANRTNAIFVLLIHDNS